MRSLGLRRPGRRGLVALGAGIAAAGMSLSGMATGNATTLSLTPPALHVSRNHLVTSNGSVVVLRGVNRSSPETQCKGTGLTSFFLGPTDDASAAAIKSWHANMVRIPVNEDCWLGRNGLPGSLNASAYRDQIASYARTLVNHGMYVLIDLHFAEVNGAPSTTFAPMADAAYGPAVWKSIASTFKSDPDVMFDLYNEPHVSWSCWRNGCTDATTGTKYAGMQTLVNAVRSTGARQPLFLTGVSWGNDVTGWLADAPYDPLHQLVSAAHVYRSSGCVLMDCLSSRMAPVAAVVPFVVTEFGDDNADGWLLAALPTWADPLGIGYLAFTWNTPSNSTIGFHLISNFDGTPTLTGAIYEAHLAAV